jgi:chorismate mutase
VKAVRGAITVSEDTAAGIAEATQALLRELAARNNLEVNEVVSIFFSVTPDLRADFPAPAARSMGWDVPMLDMQEMDVPGALPRCVRVLMHVDRCSPVRHAYLRGARELRPDLEIGE